ncbi:mechanosensitive ion channel family protein [Lawsonibacter sp. LCP25S3_G6]|uniref:mechanosensitive ion channel family protein n=1 Tax=unclassified Lawsonibacter TaxID=2617946 RepID=UPI003F9B6A0B
MDALQQVLNIVAKAVGLKELTLGSVFRVVLMILIGYLVIRMIMRVVDRLLERSKSMVDIRVYISSGVKIFLWFLLALMIAGSLNIDVTSVIAMLSVAGLAVSLALQNTLSNLAGGLQILVSKPFVVGDYIDADGTAGTVAEIGLAYTKLTTPDAKRISVPNNQLAAAKVTNYTNEGGRRVDLVFSASYDAPTETVKTAIREVLDSIPAVRQDPKPVIWINAYGASSIDYVVRAWTTTQDYWDVYYALMEGVRDSFARHKVEMTYNHLNVHLLEKK